YYVYVPPSISSFSHTFRFFYPFFFSAIFTSFIYSLTLHDALPIFIFHGHVKVGQRLCFDALGCIDKQNGPLTRVQGTRYFIRERSEEHTSELQSRFDLVCRLLLEKKKQKKIRNTNRNSDI